MKVKLLPLAIAAAIAAPGVALADGPTVYGKLNVSYEMIDFDYAYDDLDPNTADNWELLSNASRVGVKGDAAINDSLKAIYQIEWEVDTSGDKSTDLGERDRFVGLAGGFGTFQVGKFDSPLKKAQGKIDQFNDLSGDLGYMFVGENRLSNVLQYSTPSMGGVQANLAFMPGEQHDYGQDDPKDGPADSFSASVTFNLDTLYLAAAHDSEVVSKLYEGIDANVTKLELVSDSAPVDTTRLVAVFGMDALQLGAMYQMAETSNADVDGDIEQDGFLLSASFKIESIVLKGQVGMATTSYNDSNDEVDTQQIALGADYLLSKQTTVYAYYNTLSFEGDWDQSETQTKDNLGVGIVHNF